MCLRHVARTANQHASSKRSNNMKERRWQEGCEDGTGIGTANKYPLVLVRIMWVTALTRRLQQ